MQFRLNSFRQGMRSLGWSEDQNLRMEVRWGASNSITLRKHAREFVGLSSEAIMAGGTQAIAPLLEATSNIPIVFASAIDPVGAGFVSNLARPNGNVTGFTNMEYGLGGNDESLEK